MTQDFVPQVYVGDGFDYTTSGTQPSEKGVAQAKANQVRLYDLKGDPPNIGRGEIVIYDFSLQGLNHPEGDFAHHANGYMSSNMYTGDPNSLTPTPDPLINAAPIVSGTVVGQHSAYAFDRLFTGAGAGANVALWTETSATDGTPTPITWTPGASVCSLAASLTSGAERLVVGRIGAAAVKMSTVTGTVGETMHADTNSMWGMIVSGLNGTSAGVPVQLIYSGTTIKTKATDADQTTALVATNPATSVNAGGFAIGAIKPGGRAQRAYWAIPKFNNTAGALKYTAEALMEIHSTDMTGADLLPHKSFYCPNGIYGAVPYRLGMAYHDGRHVVYWDGDTEYDLGIFRQRIGISAESLLINGLNADIRQEVRGLLVNGPDLYAWTHPYDLVNGSGSIYILERYKYETGSWHGASVATGTSLGSGTAVSEGYLPGQGGIMVSHTTRRAPVYHTDTTKGTPRGWISFFVPRAAESLLWQYSQGPSSTTTTNIPFYGSNPGTMWMPNWWIDDYFPSAIRGTSSIKRLPKVVTEVEFNGNLDYGGTAGWTFQMQCFGRGIDGTTSLTAYDQTFSQGKVSADYKKRNPPTSRANVQNMQWKLVATAAAAGSTRKIPQLLPFTIRFAYSKDGSPITVLPEDNIRR